MEGGIAILLLIIVALVAGGIALAVYGMGGSLWWRRTDPQADRAEYATEERTDFVGRQARPTRSG
jgi:hypothetical protein